MWCFVHFDLQRLQMCFAPQRHAIFSTSELQKVVRTCGVLYILTCKCASCQSGVPLFEVGTSKIGPGMWCVVPFWLANALRATAACRFSRSELQKLVRECGFVHFYLKTRFAPQWRAIFISRLNSYLRTRRFSEPTFRTSGTTNHCKNTAIRDFPNIWRVWIFFLVTLLAFWSSFFWLDFSGLLFNCPYCRKLDF